MTSDRPRVGGAGRVAAGILASRLLGLVRVQLIANFFGLGRHADVLQAVFRGPNVLQNLLGEQALSAAFIPIYSRLLAEGREREAGRFAGAIFGLLLATAGAVAFVGIVFAEPIVVLLSPGYLADAAQVAAGEADLDRLPLAVRAVRILFPMTALLVLSSLALAVLNSHRRFFISYFAPVLWNTAIIVTLLVVGTRVLPSGLSGAGLAAGRSDLLLATCWGALVGGGLQFGFQPPLVFRLMRGFRLSLSRRVEGVRQALKRFVPLLAARGAAQLSGYLDLVLSSFLVAGAQGGLGNAQILYLTALAVFSLSVAAAELPELSALAGDGDGDGGAARARATAAMRAIAFWLVPTAIGYLTLGYVLVGALFRRGAFDVADNWLVAAILAAYALGLVASGWSRLLGNVFFAVGDTRTPAAIGIGRVAVSASVGAVLMLQFDRLAVAPLAGLETPLRFGAVGLALAAALSAWLELALLTRALRKRGAALRPPLGYAASRAGFALASMLPAVALWWLLREARVEILGAAVVLGYAGCYMALALATGVKEVEPVARLIRRRRVDSISGEDER